MGQLFWPDREEPQFCLRLLQLPNCPLMCFCLVCSLSLPPPVLSISLFRLLWVLSSHLNFYFLSFSFIMFCLNFSVCSLPLCVVCLSSSVLVGALLCYFVWCYVCMWCPSIGGTANAFCFCWCLFISLLTVTLIGRCACPLLCSLICLPKKCHFFCPPIDLLIVGGSGGNGSHDHHHHHQWLREILRATEPTVWRATTVWRWWVRCCCQFALQAPFNLCRPGLVWRLIRLLTWLFQERERFRLMLLTDTHSLALSVRM